LVLKRHGFIAENLRKPNNVKFEQRKFFGFSYAQQQEQDALTKLQLSSKGYTNGPPPYVSMQLILKRPTSSTSNSSPTSCSALSHKHRRHHKPPQKYLPHASRTIQM
jgi:hypothetical protein